jgi:hypothetical protein
MQRFAQNKSYDCHKPNQLGMEMSNFPHALSITNRSSLLNSWVQWRTKRSLFWKSHLLRLFQMLHDMRIMISIKKGTWSCCLRFSAASSGWAILGGVIPIEFQQAFAKLHLRNRWYRVSSLCHKQFSHEYDSRIMFFLLNIPLVLSLFLSHSQKKTLCLGWHLLFQRCL